MKKYRALLTIAIFAVVMTLTVSAEAVIDRTVSVSATATIAGTTSLSVTPTAVTFGTTSSDAFPTTPATAKVVISYGSNYNPWTIMIKTNNTQVPLQASANGRYAKGGLATADGKSVVPCKWVAKVGTNTVVPTVPTAATYNFIKDIRDEDDPATATADESWAAAGGYPNIAFGDASGNGNCVDPTNAPTYLGQAVTPASGVAVYIAGMFGTGGVSPAVPAAAGTYSSNIIFDLVHQ